METVLFLLIFFIALEVFESNWQKSNTFYGVIRNNYQVYKKSIFLFFILNPTFFYAIYLSFSLNNYSFLMNSIIILKFLDISFRLHIINKMNSNQDISSLIPIDINMTNFFRYLNVLIYPSVFFLSLI